MTTATKEKAKADPNWWDKGAEDGAPARIETEDLPPLRHFCEICGGTKQLEVHHVLFRSRGGDDERDNLMTLDRDCHDSIHRGGWTLEYVEPQPGDLVDQAQYLIIDARSDDPDTQVISRWYQPWAQATEIISQVAGQHVQVDGALQIKALASVRWDELTHVGQMLGEQELWMAISRAGLFHFTYQRRRRDDSWESVAKLFSVGKMTAIRRARMFEVLFMEHPDRLVFPPPIDVSYLEWAAQAADPEAALTYALDNYGQPGFSVTKFRQDMGLLNVGEAAAGATINFKANERRYVVCPGCDRQFQVSLPELKKQSPDPFHDKAVVED